MQCCSDCWTSSFVNNLALDIPAPQFGTIFVFLSFLMYYLFGINIPTVQIPISIYEHNSWQGYYLIGSLTVKFEGLQQHTA